MCYPHAVVKSFRNILLLVVIAVMCAASVDAEVGVELKAFENVSKDGASWDWLEWGIPYVISAKLYATTHVRAVGEMGTAVVVDARREDPETFATLTGSYAVVEDVVDIRVIVTTVGDVAAGSPIQARGPLASLSSTLTPVVISIVAQLPAGDLIAEDQRLAIASIPMPEIESLKLCVLAARALSDPDGNPKTLGKLADQLPEEGSEPQFLLGRIREAQGKMDQAEAAYRSALGADETHLAARIRLSRLLRDQGRTADAMSELEVVALQAPNHPAVQIDLSKLWFSEYRQSFDDAGAGLREQIDEYPEDATLQYQLGLVYAESGRIEDSGEAFRRATTVDPAYGDAHYKLAQFYLRTNSLDEAEVEFQAALQKGTSFPRAHCHLGEVLSLLGKNEEAVVAFQNAVKVQPEYGLAYLKMGKSLRDLNRSDEAMKAFKQYADLSVGDVRPYIEMGKISLVSGRIDEARVFLQEARVVNIGHPDCGALAESLRRATEGK